MVGRNVDWKYLAAAATVSAIIFAVIFALGYQLSTYKVSSLQENVEETQVRQRAIELGSQLSRNVQSGGCKAMKQWMKMISPKITDLRQKVASYESSSKIDNPQYKTVKKKYMNLLIQNMLQIRQMENRCGDQTVNIIYLYKQNECPACEDQGTILTYMKQQYGQNITVFPLDSSLEMTHINYIENLHNVTQYPSLIIEGEKYTGLQTKKDLEKIIQEQKNEQ